MKKVDGYSIEVIGIPSAVLMEKAAMAVAETVRAYCMKKEKDFGVKEKIVVVCGTGNNGGDGVATARILKEWGYLVSVLFLGDEKKATKETKSQLSIARKLDIEVGYEIDFNEYTIIVDAIFGIGLSRSIEGIYREAIEKINKTKAWICSVDIPSGIDADTGTVMGVAVKADVTVTFGINKIGMILYPGCEYANQIVVADIGFPKKAVEAVNSKVFYLETEDKKRLPKRKENSNKGTYGRVLIIGGSKNMCGACYLSAKAAYRTGAGLVKIMTEEENRVILQTKLPEALLSTYKAEDFETYLENNKEMEECEIGKTIIEELGWATVIVIGPGLGLSRHAEKLLQLVLQYATVPVVVDADAINLLAQNQHLREMLKNRNDGKQFIFTPHLKEMSRLSGDSIDKIKADLVSYGMEYAKKEKICLVLKDARTVISDGEICYVNCSGNNGMSTGGSGDVLTGIIAGLLAQKATLLEAGAFGAYLHGLAADRESLEGNTYSLIASDIIKGLKKEITQ